MSLRIAVLISGEGTNLQALLDAIRSGTLPAKVVLVLSNVATANGLNRARREGVPTAGVRHQDFASREAFDDELIRRLEGVELVLLAGFMRVLSKKFVDRFRGRIMNVHPALLPAFPGGDAVKKAWEAGAKATGVTVHFVDEGVDTGPIILQEPVPVKDGETLDRLTTRIHEVEHRLYPEAVRLFAEGKLSLAGRKVKVER